MKSGTENKLKFKQLQRRLDLSLWKARGLLDTLWNFASHNCPSGDIGRFSDEEIATGIDWRDGATDLISALVETRWLDRDSTHRLIVHGWAEHCEDNVHKLLARRISAFADGTVPSMSRLSKDERAQIEPQYKVKYGAKSLKSGRVSVRTENAQRTPRNAPALPCPTPPYLTPPSLSCAASAATDEPQTPDAKPRAEDVPVPTEIDTQAFRAVARDWFAQRRRRRLPLNADYVSGQYRKLAALGNPAAIECVRYTVDQEYQGLFPERFTNGKRPKNAAGPGQTYDPSAAAGDPEYGRM